MQIKQFITIATTTTTTTTTTTATATAAATATATSTTTTTTSFHLKKFASNKLKYSEMEKEKLSRNSQLA